MILNIENIQNWLEFYNALNGIGQNWFDHIQYKYNYLISGLSYSLTE